VQLAASPPPPSVEPVPPGATSPVQPPPAAISMAPSRNTTNAYGRQLPKRYCIVFPLLQTGLDPTIAGGVPIDDGLLLIGQRRKRLAFSTGLESRSCANRGSVIMDS
jgi:hypothetical protein